MDKLGLWDVPLSSVCNKVQCSSPPNTTALESSSSRTATINSARTEFIDKLRQKYPAVFADSLGRCSMAKATLQLHPDVKPVFRQKRPVPYAALPDVDQELDRLEKLGVISQVNYSSWAAPIVVAKKANGSIRICADFSTGLNDALELHQYPLPLPEDIFTTLNGGQIFSQIDFADAYLQVEVDNKSKELLTINTHRGLYQYNRLPFGVKSAPGIFQQIMDTMLADVPGAAAYLDDVIVVGRTEEEHRANLDTVFKRIEEFGFHIRLDKCKLFMPQVKYLGFIIDKYGRRPDPAKIEAIQNMPPPTDVTTLRSFLGLINYYGNFIKEMRELRAPLDALLKKDTKWNWSKACQNAFDRTKAILSSDLLLTHYDPHLDIVVAADASNYGIGAVISHRFPDGSEKAIAHASRSLTATEKNYGQIDKEALALVFAVKKFHRMIHGRKFTLLTDHKPLLAVFGSKKGIPVYTANRLQRWATTLLAYNFSIEYLSTTSFGQADALSRLIASHAAPDEDFVIAAIAVDADVRRVFNDSVRALPVTARMVSDATVKDPLLQRVISCLQSHWPEKISSSRLQQFYQRRESLSILDGCLLFSDRVVVPEELQKQVLHQLHSGHPGMVRMKSLARSYVYWPGLDSQVEDIVRNCTHCATAAKLPVKTTLSSWPVPERPWARVHVDFAGPHEGQNFMVVVDAYSKWPEIFIMDRTTTTATINQLQKLFAQFGMPELLVSDNGTQFTSAAFSDFCSRNGIKHMRSSAYHPQSNGQAERFVDTFKRALLKLKGEGTTAETLQTFLLSYRSTPNASLTDNITPAEAFLSRPLRTSMDLIRPVEQSKRRNEQMESQFNKHHGARFRAYKPGDPVYARDFRGQQPTWSPGKIIRKRGKVLYEVQVDSRTWIRHANQLRACPASQLQKSESSPSDDTLECLLDTFSLDPLQPVINLPAPAVEPPRNPDVLAPAGPVNVPAVNVPSPRRSERIRVPVRPLQVDPAKKSYS